VKSNILLTFTSAYICKVIPLKLTSKHNVIQQKSINKFYAVKKDNQAMLILINFNNAKYCEDPTSAP